MEDTRRSSREEVENALVERDRALAKEDQNRREIERLLQVRIYFYV